MKTKNAIHELQKDKRVSSVSDERGSDDGFWVYLKDGWNNGQDPVGAEHIIHEDTPDECLKLMELVERCHCVGCKEAKAIA